MQLAIEPTNQCDVEDALQRDSPGNALPGPFDTSDVKM
jgi:hypothetical protein